jgi:type I restriction enzyme S subunit
MKYGLTETTVENICAVFAHFPEIEKAILYGSRAKGNFKTGSDIDLTICGEALTSDLRSTIASALDDLLLPYTIDLSVFNELNHAKLREHIERVGVLFYERANHGAAAKKGWQRRKLGDVLDVQNGYAFDSKAFNPSKGMPLIRIRSLKAGTETETRFTGDYDEKYVVKAGDLLIGMDGEFGCYEWKGTHALLNQRVCRLQGFTSELLPRFLFYGVNSHLKAIEDVTGYATVKHLSSKQILGIEFPIPPIPEQQRIVGILDEAFEGIAAAKANAEKNLQNARALFESHLQSVFTQRGPGWDVRKIAEVAKHSLGKMLDKAKNKGKLQPYLRNINVRWFTFDLSDLLQMPFLPEESAKYTAIKGDVLICEGGYPGRAAIWAEDYPIYFQKALHRVRFHESMHNKWFLYYLYAQDKSGKLKQHFSGTGIQHFTGEVLARFELPLPPLPELRRAVAKFEELSAETQRLESIYQQKLDALEALKKSLLHQAFSGHW